MRKLPADAVIALVLLAGGGFVLNDLLNTEGTGAFVKNTTLPIALVIALMALATVLGAASLFRARKAGDVEPAAAPAIDTAGLARVAVMVGWIIAYTIALPLFGYVASSIAFLIGANLLYGNRNPWSIAGIAVIVPVILLFFFERFMVVLLPSARLFE